MTPTWPTDAPAVEADRSLHDRALLISIQPRFAEAILDGSKTLELRRTAPTLVPSALALIYASSPTKALVGSATVLTTLQSTPSDLWSDHREATGVTSDEYQKYFAGRSQAFGLRLAAVERARCPVGLADLRSHGLEPPQSWRYLTSQQAMTLRLEMGELSARLDDAGLIAAAG